MYRGHRPGVSWCVAAVLLLCAARAFAHPVAQGTLEIVVGAGGVRVAARVSMEEVIVSNTQGVSPPPTGMQEAIERHGYYLLQHIRLQADGAALRGRLVSAAEEESAARDHALYEFEFELPERARPARLRVEQDVLSEFDFAPGNPWEAFYQLRMGMEGGGKLEGLLSGKMPVVFGCTWKEASLEAAVAPAKAAEAQAPGVLVQLGLLLGIAAVGILLIFILRER